MNNRRYYSVRTGKNAKSSELDLMTFLHLFLDLYAQFEDKGYFQQAFGYNCVDAGYVAGTLGSHVIAQIARILRKGGLWPLTDRYETYSEEDAFDIIEFLYDHISKPTEGYNHTFNACGWHYHTFDVTTGRQEFRKEINELLLDYGQGYELSEAGEILALAEEGLDSLLEAELPVFDDENVDSRVKNAILKFRRYKSSPDDRRDAIRDLADVLEFLRPKLKSVLTKSDENDLFNLANNFGIRHHNESQKSDYDRAIWYSWMFYYYLAFIHAAVRLIQQQEQSDTP